MSKHRAPRHTLLRRRGRLGALALAVIVAGGVVAGGVVAGGVPQQGADANATASVSASSAALETAAFAQIEAPKREPAEAKKERTNVEAAVDTKADPALPADSGDGYRIVFSQSQQRVWLVDAGEQVERTYLVSGSRFDNLDPGTYAVQSRSRHATAFDYSGTMEYFVRFATGYSAPIGFHTVPRYNNGELEQTKAELGTPLSAGCVRQWEPDAIALWEFAPIGTTVIVTP